MVNRKPPKSSFAPIVSAESRILILGSLPGEASLAAGEYYAHPRNRFWRVLAEIADAETPADYPQKLELLTRLGVGLWDVVGTAERIGSLDSNIADPIPNPIDRLLLSNPRIEIIGFNGATARKIFERHFAHLEIERITLPSTSPANAAFDVERLVSNWRRLFRHHA